MLAPAVKFEIQDEKSITVEIKADLLGYNLELNEQYDPVNEQHVEAWEQINENFNRKNHPIRPFTDRLNKLDQDFSCVVLNDYESLSLGFKFAKVHSSSEVIRPLWTDVMREVVAICNLHRTRQGLAPFYFLFNQIKNFFGQLNFT